MPTGPPSVVRRFFLDFAEKSSDIRAAMNRTTQAQLIDDLGGYHVIGARFAEILENGEDGTAKKWSERVRKWREMDHIPPKWRPYVKQFALGAGLALPEELKDPQINAA